MKILTKKVFRLDSEDSVFSRNLEYLVNLVRIAYAPEHPGAGDAGPSTKRGSRSPEYEAEVALVHHVGSDWFDRDHLEKLIAVVEVTRTYNERVWSPSGSALAKSMQDALGGQASFLSEVLKELGEVRDLILAAEQD